MNAGEIVKFTLSGLKPTIDQFAEPLAALGAVAFKVRFNIEWDWEAKQVARVEEFLKQVPVPERAKTPAIENEELGALNS